ncbi:Glycosyl transferase, family 2 [Chitinispirillum alkaliphilum]|nr:Glycosyl transferase, family 2 [Chitinispirillum alkaliphilum]
MNPDISIIIVNWNTSDMLKSCIHSILEHTRKVSYEIIVVDNASDDDSVTMIKEDFPQSRIFALNENIGFSRGNNIGLLEATGRYVLFLNPDTELTSDACSAMVDFLDSNKEYGAVGCKLLNRDNTVQQQCARAFPTPWKQFCFLSMLNRLFAKSPLFSTIELGHWDHNDSRDIECLSGACICAPRALITQLGGMDENIFMYSEDVDLCLRIINKGFKIRYLADEAIFHYDGSASKKNKNRYFSTLLQRNSQFYFFKKHFGALEGFKYRFAVLSGAAIRVAVLMASLAVSLPFRNKHTLVRDALAKYTALFLWAVTLKVDFVPQNSHRHHPESEVLAKQPSR